MLGLAVVLIGLGMLAAAWLQLCRQVASTTGPERGVQLVRQAVLVWSAPLLLAPPLFSRDGWSYAAQGMLTHVDLSPYLWGPGVLMGPIKEAVDPRWMHTPAPYGPVPLIAGDLASGLTVDPWLLVIVHRFVALSGLVLLAWAVPRLAGWCGVNPALSSALALASPLMLANGVGGLHNDLLMVGLMAAALVVSLERGWYYGAVLGGLAAAVKLPGGLVCIAIALLSLPVTVTLSQRLRRLVQVGAVACTALVVPGLVWGLGVGWIGALTVPGTVKTPLSLPTVAGQWLDLIAGVIGVELEPDTMLGVMRLIAQLGIVVVVLHVALRGRTGRGQDAVQALVLMMSATILLSPVVHIWYFLWVVPFIAAMQLSRVAMGGLLAGSVIFGVVAPMDSSLHGAYLAIVIGSMIASAVGLVLLIGYRRAGAILPLTSASRSTSPSVPEVA